MPANTRIWRKHGRVPLESLEGLRYMQNTIHRSERSSTKQENTLLRHALPWIKLKGILLLLSKTKAKQYLKVTYYRIPLLLLFPTDIYRSNTYSSVPSLCIGDQMGTGRSWKHMHLLFLNSVTSSFLVRRQRMYVFNNKLDYFNTSYQWIVSNPYCHFLYDKIIESSFKPETIEWECDCLYMTMSECRRAHSSSWARFVYALIICDTLNIYFFYFGT